MKKKLTQISKIILFCLFNFIQLNLRAQVIQPKTTDLPKCSSDLNRLKVVFYNTYNLFNATHEENTNDYEFLPKEHPLKEEGCKKNAKDDKFFKVCMESNWTNEMYNAKLDSLEKVLKINGELPDIIGLVEVEGDSVVQDLANKIGYSKFVINRDTDSRSIQVAVIYNDKNPLLKFIGSKSHEVLKVIDNKSYLGRDILEVNFQFKEDNFDLYVSHWPSQNWPKDARESVAVKLVELFNLSKINNNSVLMMGDFNTFGDELKILENSSLTNLYHQKKKLFPKNELPLGTYFYDVEMRWSLFDHMYYFDQSHNLKNNLLVDVNSYQILNRSDIVKDYIYSKGFHKDTIIKNVPKPFDNKTFEGSSDHFPIYTEICSSVK